MGQVGRPSEYTPEVGERLLDRLAAGETLRAICDDSDMPYRRTVRRWREESPEFAAAYARARAVGLDQLADETVAVADSATAEDVAVARLRVDTRKWLVSKLAAKKYGERIAHEVEGSGGGPVRLEHGVDTDPDRLAALSKLLGEISGDGS